MVFLKTFVSLMVKNATFCKKYLVDRKSTRLNSSHRN